MSASESLAVIRERAAKIHVVSGEGTITLTDAKGRNVRLDAAFVFAPPDRARVRAWKFGQAVLDLTIVGEETWLFVPPRQSERADALKSASSESGHAIREWLQLLTRGVGDDQVIPTEDGGELLVATQRDNGLLMCRIDRETLTPRKYMLLRKQNESPVFLLTLSKYRTVGDTVWPTVIDAESLNGHVKIELRDVTLDDAPPASAFKPPARAVKL